MVKFVFFLSFLSCITFVQAQSPDTTPLSELKPLLESLSTTKSAYETAKELENFLEKATDIAIATLEKSGSSIPKAKLEELRQDIHDQMEDLVDDLYIPLDID